MDELETKSVAESDTGQPCGDLLSEITSLAVAELDYEEPSLSDIIVEMYKGERGNNGRFEGEGEAVFIGGNEYKGTFSNGVMHGKGKFTWTDGMQYDGDLQNNQISGYGRYEWKDKSYYEGEVYNGSRHGVGVFKSPQNNVSYSGQWYLGKRHGRGIMHYSEHSWYEGDWLNNSRHGWGVRRYHTGNVYEGQWVNGKRHGEGTMRWLTTNESYSGIWENGVQHGCGTHTWYLHRVPGSQYPLRNEYVGDFVNGLRHGHGKFFFASGAVYNGEWENNRKHGWGKFIFKNGKVFEGQFENDHMVDYPSFHLDGNQSPDFTQNLPPVNLEEEKEMLKDGSGNILGPGLTLDIDFILEGFEDAEREAELKQITFLILRNISMLRRVYSFYSGLGHDRSPDNTFVMTKFQFWRFVKDCHIHHHKLTLSAMDRVIAKCHASGDVHNPMEKLLFREFLSSCVVLGYNIYKDSATKKNSVIATCFQSMIEKHILKFSCRVGGHFLFEPRRAVNALAYMDRCWHIYQHICLQRSQPPYEPTLRMRQFLFLLQDLKLIGGHLSTTVALQLLSADDPTVSDGENCNMELEMTFLEFFEALIGCAIHFVPADVAIPSETSNTQSGVSRPGSSASQLTSRQEGGTSENEIQDDSSYLGSKSQISSHSHDEHSRNNAASTGEFLHTLSQLSSVNEGQTTADTEIDTGSTPHISKQESEFSLWCTQLSIFFTQHLFPSWNRHEALREAAAKNCEAEKEAERLGGIRKAAEQRKKQQLDEIKLKEEQSAAVMVPEIAEIIPSTDDLKIEKVVSDEQEVKSNVSHITVKSGKSRRKKN